MAISEEDDQEFYFQRGQMQDVMLTPEQEDQQEEQDEQIQRDQQPDQPPSQMQRGVLPRTRLTEQPEQQEEDIEIEEES